MLELVRSLPQRRNLTKAYAMLCNDTMRLTTSQSARLYLMDLLSVIPIVQYGRGIPDRHVFIIKPEAYTCD